MFSTCFSIIGSPPVKYRARSSRVFFRRTSLTHASSRYQGPWGRGSTPPSCAPAGGEWKTTGDPAAPRAGPVQRL